LGVEYSHKGRSVNKGDKGDKDVKTLVLVVSMIAGTALAQNLLVNPGAETGNTTGWTDPDVAWAAAAAIAPHSGAYFFWPAVKDLSQTTLYQDVDVSSSASQIDAGLQYLHLSGWLANWNQYPHDQATLAIQALSSSAQQLLYLSRSHRSPVWTRYAIDAAIPAGTRTLRVLLTATRFVGSDNDGYFDDLELSANTNVPTVSVTITPAGGQPLVAVGETLQLTALTTGGIDTNYAWQSSFTGIATVNTNGLVTATQAGRFFVQAEGLSTHALGSIELVAYETNSIVITKPASGTAWESGSTTVITWNVIGSVPTGMLYYSTSGGGTWTAIAPIPDTSVGYYDWTVPATDVPLNSCLVKMTWTGSESVSGIFSIMPATPPEVSITSIQLSGTNLVLEWSANKTGLSYSVEFCTNLFDGGWSPVQPTSQWWITRNVWTNTQGTTQRQFFKLKAKQ
jgi:hypothetical protein